MYQQAVYFLDRMLSISSEEETIINIIKRLINEQKQSKFTNLLLYTSIWLFWNRGLHSKTMHIFNLFA